jgi:GNAT superfamily N-acetyltransferase
MMFVVDTDKARLDVARIHRFLAEESTWALGIPLATVERSIEHSLCWGGYVNGEQVAFARVITDQATFAYLLDVFVLPAHQGNGYSKLLMDAIMADQRLQGLRRFMLATTTAPWLYERYGFAPPAKPEALMERNFPDIYRKHII